MRRIGTLSDQSQADRFCDYLLTIEIEATADSDDGDPPEWNLWIRDEQDVDRAREEFEGFQRSPDDSRYRVENEVSKIRNEKIAEQQRKLKQRRELVRSMPAQSGPGSSTLMGSPTRQQSIPVVISIIVLSIIASFGTDFGMPHTRGPEPSIEDRAYDALSVTDPMAYAQSREPYEQIKKGQVWRFFTPMFMHGDPMHLAFNMLWIFFLGSAIERLQGSFFLLLLIAGTHFVGINTHVLMSQMDFLPDALSGSPFAIGASGAVYGLFGYLWIRPAVDPAYPIRLVPMNVALMLGWLVLCMTPMIPNVANGAHLGGLFAGMGAAMIAPRLKNG